MVIQWSTRVLKMMLRVEHRCVELVKNELLLWTSSDVCFNAGWSTHTCIHTNFYTHPKLSLSNAVMDTTL